MGRHKQPVIKERYQVDVRNTFKILQTQRDVEVIWQEITTTEAVAEEILYRPNGKRSALMKNIKGTWKIDRISKKNRSESEFYMNKIHFTRKTLRKQFYS